MKTRRQFLNESGLLLAAASIARGQSGPAQSPDWCERPMRWFQLAFVEDDPGNYKPDFWLDYFRRIHAEELQCGQASSRAETVEHHPGGSGASNSPAHDGEDRQQDGRHL